MATRSSASVTCPNCQSPFNAPVTQVIDVEKNPEAKARLLSGQLNLATCPHCGFQGGLNVPFLYHDADLEIAFVYAPLEVGESDAERQKIIGDLTNSLIQGLAPEERKGYLLQPRTFFSQKTLVEAILEEDQETREMIERQEHRMELVDQLSQIEPQDTLAMAEFVGANDQELDDVFFQFLDLRIRIAEGQGQQAEQERLEQHRETLLEKSSMGRLLIAQQAAVDALRENPNRDTLIEQLIAADAPEIRETLVMAGRQLLDYAFFQKLTARIQATKDAEDKEKLVALRKEVQETRDEVDAMMAAVLESRAKFLQDLLFAENPMEIAVRRLPELDNLFFSVLAANLQQARNEGREDIVQRLESISNMVARLMHEFSPPPLKLINRLINVENEEQIDQILQEEREHLDKEFVALVEGAIEDLEQEERNEDAERLRYVVAQLKETGVA